MDLEKRKALYAEFQKIVAEDVPLYFTHEAIYHTVRNKENIDTKTSVWGGLQSGDGLYWENGQAPKK